MCYYRNKLIKFNKIQKNLKFTLCVIRVMMRQDKKDMTKIVKN
jgi:hypothetical protein